MAEMIIKIPSLSKYQVMPRHLSIMLPNVNNEKKQAIVFINPSESK
jgi:hypothetical protein